MSLSIAILFAMVACNGGSPSTGTSSTGSTATGTSHPSGPAAPVDDVGVKIREVGPAMVGPTRVIVHTRDGFFAAGYAGGVPPEGSELVIVPPVDGAWTVTDGSTLTFVPTDGFAPDTAYQVVVKQLSDGTTTHSPVGAGWTHAFKTPAFSFARLGLRTHEIDGGRLVIDLLFTGAVDAKAVAQHASFTWRGQTVKATKIEAGSDPWDVQATFVGKTFRDDGKLTVDVEAGVPLHANAAISAAAGHSELDVKPGEPIEILATKVREGANGFYVDVICKDSAVKTSRYYWDNQDYESYDVSSRCLLSDDEVTSAVHLDPGAELSVASAPGGFRLFAPLERGNYHLRIDAGAASVDGGVLPEAYETDLVVPARSPSVSFATSGRYLPHNEWNNLPIRHRNVDRATVEIRYIPESNLVFWMTDSDEAATDRTSDLIVSKDISLASDADKDVTTWLDVASMLPKPERGVYEITVKAKVKKTDADKHASSDTGYEAPEEDDDAGYRVVSKASSRVLVTDMHLIAKVGAPAPDSNVPSEVRAWSIGVEDNLPIAAVEIKLIRASGKVIGSCVTDGSGGCSVALVADPIDKSPPIALIARHDGDLTYVKFADLRVESDADVAGVSWSGDSPYRAALYPDRGVYRPGETAHLTAIVRDRAHVAPKEGLPAVLQVLDPQDKVLKKLVLTTNAAGMLEADVPFADFARTGRYRARVEIADRSVGDVSFNVEEFVPERMRVTATADSADGVRADEPVSLNVSAQWLFGGSAEGSHVQIDCEVKPSVFAPPGRAGWSFGPANVDGDGDRPVSLGTVQGEIAADGTLKASCPAMATGTGFASATELDAQVSVFEGDTGRTTVNHARVPVHPESYYVGLRAPHGRIAASGPTAIDGILVGWDGKSTTKAGKDVSIEVLRLEREYGWMWDPDAGSSEYRRMTRRSRETDTTVTAAADGSFHWSFEPTDRGADYLIVARDGGARTELVVEGAGWYGWWGSSESSNTPRPERPGALPMDAPAEVHVGDAGKVKLIAPYAGRALFTVETDHVLTSEWLDVAEGPVEWPFTVSAFAPNVYVTALIVKNPHGESPDAFLPDRAFGATSVRVIPDDYTHTLQISVPVEVRPNSHFEVALDLGPQPDGTFATVAAVDEGILSLTKFADPDPLESIFEKRRLGVDSYETIGWTLALPPGAPARTGGDEETSGGRVQSVHPVSLWSGVLPVPKDGKLKVGFDVPGYRGSLRVMAVTAGPTKIGHAATSLTVKDPLTLQTTLPRFLLVDDMAQIPVTLTNMSGKDRDIVVSISAANLPDGDPAAQLGGDQPAPVEFAGGQERKVSIAAGKTDTVVFSMSGTRAPAAVGLRVTAKSGELESHEEISLPIEPSQPESRSVKRFDLSGGTVDITSELADWLPGTDRTTLWVTTNPYASAMATVSTLVRYPHGCIEQTTSATRPLLYAGALLKDTNPEDLKGKPLDAMIASGIERVLAMQTPSGGFAYWPGGTSADAWGTVYATHFLIDAKKAGNPIPQRAIDDAVSWLSRDAEKVGTSAVPDRENAYAQYVLAIAGKGRPAQARNLLATLDKDPKKALSEERYLLMAALWVGGDRRFEAQLKSPDTSPIRPDRSWDSTYWSDLRGRGMMLSTFYDLFGADPAGQGLADVVAQGLSGQQSWYYTTQEMAWGVTGLGKWLGVPAPIQKASVSLGGKAATPLSDKGKSGTVFRVHGATLVDDVSVSATAATPVWLIASIDGTRKVNDVPYGGVGLAVKRELLDVNGRPLQIGALTLGQAGFVRLTVVNTSGRKLDDVALIDRLPAGLEIENSRLGRGEMPPFVDTDALWDADHMDLRDDRVQVYGTLWKNGSATVVYAVRAVTAGTFTWPDVSAESMYDPRVWARMRGDGVRITSPWP